MDFRKSRPANSLILAGLEAFWRKGKRPVTPIFAPSPLLLASLEDLLWNSHEVRSIPEMVTSVCDLPLWKGDVNFQRITQLECFTCLLTDYTWPLILIHNATLICIFGPGDHLSTFTIVICMKTTDTLWMTSSKVSKERFFIKPIEKGVHWIISWH